MKAGWCLVLVLSRMFGLGHCRKYCYDTLNFTTKVDHFGYANNDTFEMRYLFSDQFWDHNVGPILFLVGAEGDIESQAKPGLIWEWAAEFKALVIFAEHRYYGHSMPYGERSYQGSRYHGYLTAEQALADYADLLVHIKANVPGAAKSKVVSFGGSYGGMLAAWFRIKYPHVTQAALASSAPILMFTTPRTPCNDFANMTTKTFANVSGRCVEAIRKFFGVMKKLAAREQGAKTLQQQLHQCHPVDTKKFLELRDKFGGIYIRAAMTNYPRGINKTSPVKTICSFLNRTFSDDIELLQAVYKGVEDLVKPNCSSNQTNVNLGTSYQDAWRFLGRWSREGYDDPTADENERFPDQAKSEKTSKAQSPGVGLRSWGIQLCNEMVWHGCLNGKTDMFYDHPLNLTNDIKECQEKHGLTPDVNKTMLMFGGKNILPASNIIFSNGGLDPWSAGGILKNLSKNLVAVYMPDAAHTHDLLAADPGDPPSLVEGRKQEKRLIKKWLRQKLSRG